MLLIMLFVSLFVNYYASINKQRDFQPTEHSRVVIHKPLAYHCLWESVEMKHFVASLWTIRICGQLTSSNVWIIVTVPSTFSWGNATSIAAQVSLTSLKIQTERDATKRHIFVTIIPVQTKVLIPKVTQYERCQFNTALEPTWEELFQTPKRSLCVV